MNNIEKILDLMCGYGYDAFVSGDSIHYSKDGFTHTVSINGIIDLLNTCEIGDITAIMKSLHSNKQKLNG